MLDFKFTKATYVTLKRNTKVLHILTRSTHVLKYNGTNDCLMFHISMYWSVPHHAHICGDKLYTVNVPRHGEAIGGGGGIEMLGIRLSVRPSVTKLVSAITSDFMHRFTQYLTQ